MAVVATGGSQACADAIGKQIFQEGADGMPACAICHTLSDAGATGEIGPSLDDLKPDTARVRIAVHDGVGVMPAFGESLSAAEIDAVASYVADVAGR
jgi:sulfite dehydrogenase